MRVAFDARELEGRPTGVGRVLSGLLAAWPAGDELHLVCRTRPLGELPRRCSLHVELGSPRLPGSVWEQTTLVRAVTRAGADVLVCPAYGMPWRSPCPTAVGMHDCAFAALPGTFRPRERLRRRLTARIAARRAAFLFMGSEFAAREANRWLGVDRRRLQVLPYGVDPRFRPASAQRVEALRARFDLGPDPILFAGSQLSRRRLPDLAEAIAGVVAARPGAELCLVGTQPAGDSGDLLSPGARWLGYVPDVDMPALYSAAAVVVYPSRYEGFGLPVLEALACATPVLTSDTGALAEIFRDRALLLPTDDATAWAQALARLLDDAQARADWGRRGAAWARTRDWSTPAGLLRRRLAATVGSS